MSVKSTKFGIQLLGIALAATLSACGGGSNDAATQPAVAKVNRQNDAAQTNTVTVSDGQGGTRQVQSSVNAYQPPASPESAKAKSSLQSRSVQPFIAKFDLGAVSAEKSQKYRQAQSELSMGKAMQISFPREVVQAKSSGDLAGLLKWTALPAGGNIAAMQFSSGGAQGLRIGLLVTQLAPEATLRFYAQGSNDTVEVSGKAINELLANNLAAGDKSDDGRTFWGPYLKGETGVVEIELPKGVDPATTAIAVPSVSHFFFDPLDKQSLIGTNTGPGTNQAKAGAAVCELDISCNTPLTAASNAVAQMEFVDKGNGYLCTGTLLNNTNNDRIPYFLSANHCISTQTVASTLSTYWFYKSSGCNNGILNPNYVSRIGGAKLLWNQSIVSGANGANPVGTDTSFMRLTQAPPSGAVYAGWSAIQQSPGNGLVYTAVHSPMGDLLKYSLGSINAYGFILADGSTFYSPLSNSFGLYRVLWNPNSGVTEPGSSGSALFLTASTNPQVVGQLFGGSSLCTAPTNPDYYGRFDIAFINGLAQWLSPQANAIYRFYNSASGSYFYTISVSERDSIVLNYPTFKYEGPAYSASPIPSAGLFPVYRFRNLANGSYLWTIYEAERNSIKSNYSASFVEEGVAWYAYQSQATGTLPLYRFRNLTNSTYFYTANEAEKNNVLAVYATTFALEGVAYYVTN